MSNHHLRNENLSLKAKGLLSIMLSLPSDWDYSIAGLCSITKEGKVAIKIKAPYNEDVECEYTFDSFIELIQDKDETINKLIEA